MRRAAPLAWLLLLASAANAQTIEGPSKVPVGVPIWFKLKAPAGTTGSFFPAPYLTLDPAH